MKKSEFRSLIREEIKKVLNEAKNVVYYAEYSPEFGKFDAGINTADLAKALANANAGKEQSIDAVKTLSKNGSSFAFDSLFDKTNKKEMAAIAKFLKGGSGNMAFEYDEYYIGMSFTSATDAKKAAKDEYDAASYYDSID